MKINGRWHEKSDGKFKCYFAILEKLCNVGSIGKYVSVTLKREKTCIGVSYQIDRAEICRVSEFLSTIECYPTILMRGKPLLKLAQETTTLNFHRMCYLLNKHLSSFQAKAAKEGTIILCRKKQILEQHDKYII